MQLMVFGDGFVYQFLPRLQRHNSHRSWDFAVVHVSGHDDVSVADVTTTLDHSLGTKGACLGAAVNGCGGPGTDHHRNLVWKLLKHQRKGVEVKEKVVIY